MSKFTDDQGIINTNTLLAGGFVGDVSADLKGASPFLSGRIKHVEEKKPSSLQVLKSAFELENTVSSSLVNVRNAQYGDNERNLDYDLFGKIEGTKYEQHIESFKDVYNDSDLEWIKAKIDNEEFNREIISSAGGFGIASLLLAGVFDPINLIPVGGTAYKFMKAGKVAKTALQTAKVGFVTSTGAEAILQSQQELRTLQEGVINIGGATVLSGLVGGAVGVISKKQLGRVAKNIDKDLQDPSPPFQMAEDGSLSAAKNPVAEGEEGLAGGIITKGLIKLTKKLNPTLRVLESQSDEAKSILERMIRPNLYKKKNFNGLATAQSVEIKKKMWLSGLGDSKISNLDLWKQANKRLKKEGKKISRAEFNDEVSKAMISGDKSDMPEVQKMAIIARNKVINPLRDEAINVGLLNEGVKENSNYLMRIYNTKKVVAKSNEFQEILDRNVRNTLIPSLKKNALQEQGELTISLRNKKIELENLKKQKASNTKIQKAETELATTNTKLDKFNQEIGFILDDEDLLEDYIADIVDSIYNNVTGTERAGGALPYDVKIGVRGPAKERTLAFISDHELRPFLETDIDKVLDRYTEIMSTDIELKREFGSLTLEKEFTAINNDYNIKRRRLKTEKERLALDKEQKDVLNILESFKDILRGNYGNWRDPDNLTRRVLHSSRTLNYLSKLGGVTVSSVPDLARPIMIHGYSRVFKNLNKLIGNTKGLKLSIKDAKLAGNILEKVLHNRTMLMADLGNPYTRGSAFEKMLSSLSDNFSKLTGMDDWNNTMKGFSSILTQQRLIENIKNFDNLSGNESAYMAFLGIDRFNIGKLKNQIGKFASSEDELFVANLAKWDDVDASRIYKSALNNDVERTIVTRGVGDVPLFMNTDFGKTIFQFKSFSFAAHQQVLLAGLQQADTAFVSGTATMIGLGMLVYYLKSKIAGREVSDDPNRWIAEGIDRSGIISALSEVNMYADSGGLGVSRLLDNKPLSRYASRNRTGSLLGPSFGMAQDLSQILTATGNKAFDGQDLKESDFKAMRRMLPYQNLFYVRGVLNQIKE